VGSSIPPIDTHPACHLTCSLRQEFAEPRGMVYLETSAKTGAGVWELFTQLGGRLVEAK
jgi:hypothetical protein